MNWNNRIVGLDPAADPEQLLASPGNPKIHPAFQSKALTAALSEIGWVGAVTVNRNTGHVIDGHLRVAEAISAGATVPVLYVDLSDEEERKALATFDLIGDAAVVDVAALADLASEVTFASAALDTLIANQLVDSSAGVDGEPAEAPEPADPTGNPLVWGYLTWSKQRRVNSTETEITAFDALYEVYVKREGSDIGFVRWITEAAIGVMDD